ncbi:unnamed protein product (macronuclear) [Paramecium tetraurelia]|uniref:Transmembrane protein n=1 Tax=Paramecium tetraurelia TaxID=5888 RepID=A0BML2_PARTE|nr:uncharacterized protein GSPATT00030415001 [Paramecium tetraurelia]CAK59779.1 unnamed protein product [Paramecium tetraurelia]|eukprot:XP_001427177.1 hypothetical protein (macronuclear) [Paramecium tetraurelia strain d4-2]
MNSKSHQKTTIAEDQMENHQQSFKSMERISICQPFSSKEFFNRQKLYDDLYNTNQIKCESLNSIRLEKGMKQSKYKDIVESAKLKHAQSPNNISNSIMKLQQNSITDIVEQLRNQKKANNVKLQSSVNNLKKQQQLNLNLILIIAIPLLCCLVVIFEMARIKEQNTN